jgi:hypothetical protein
MDNDNVLDFLDHDQKRYVFTKKNYLKHIKKHKELLEVGYLKTIEKLIRNCPPKMIFPSYKQHNSYVYYQSTGKESINGTWYNRAIICKTPGVYNIETAFRSREYEIRERRYGEPVKKRP